MTTSNQNKKIGRYAITGTLGKGGMGTVYRAVMPTTGKIVALKYLDPAEPLVLLLGMERIKALFASEAKTIARLQHPNIVDIWDFDYDDDKPFYTMAYYCNNIGKMIGERYIVEETSRIIPPEKVIDYGSRILAGLECMHHAGIIHRDIKPYNILLTYQDTVKICDFGMSKEQEEKSLNADGLKIGSPYYTSPEQSRDPDTADHRSDLYSTGVLLYRMITGELPGMKSFMLSRINPIYDEKWDAFFEKILSWLPDERFQSATEMAKALQGLELHWEKLKEQTCATPRQAKDENAKARINLRNSPIQVSGRNARDGFAVNELFQPKIYINNRFTNITVDTVFDEQTDLIWQRSGSEYPLERQEADRYIETINEIQFAGATGWRLPTVNELLSLVNQISAKENNCDSGLFDGNKYWLWSCDRRSEKTSWYVNMKLSYAGWQEAGCRNHVKAVRTSS